ncbi:RHS repeat protein [Iodobacter sp. HSC-16F04]|uniref:RHS repeat protein n=1 Tax=Iodobacter violaceini TaxID=3044271 RepID=A0ABX0L2W8_9NEIS|nr:RHS repeat-associated core domain-containing protein [Iodobacter violacea]NHQ88544.1 RHS repeat protein [Iodobacter violacea]
MSETRQVAHAPYGKETVADTQSAIGSFDTWLKKVSDNHVSLDDLQTVASALPVVGNLIAAGDMLVNLYDISQKKEGGDFGDWMGVGINGIGLIPAPGTAALRISMRPVLGSVRQALIRGGKTVGPALVDVIVSHILASEALAQKAEDAVTKMLNVISPMMKEVADFVSKVIEQFTTFLKQLINGTLGKYRVPAGKAPSKGEFVRNPAIRLGSFFGEACQFYRKAVATVASKAASALLSDKVKQTLTDLLNHLNNSIKPQIVGKITALADAKAKQSLVSLLTLLLAAITKGKKKAAAGAVAVGKTTKVVAKRAQQVIEQVSSQIKAKLSPNGCKECKTKGKSRSTKSIGYALGDEVFSHTDFSLNGVMPLVWQRTYNSRLAAYDQGELGARWTSPLSTRFDLINAESGPILRHFDADGRSLDYPALAVGEHHQDRTEGLMLSRLDENLLTITRGHELLEVYERYESRFMLRMLKDRAGNTLALSYDAAGLLQQIDLSSGSSAKFERNAAGKISRISTPPSKELPAGRVLAEYSYNEHGDLISAKDEHGNQRDYQYKNHLITRYTDRTGRGVNLEWDGSSATSKAIREFADDGSNEIRLSWHDDIRLTTVRNAHGDETLYYFDALGYTYRIIYPDNSEEWLFRDDYKNLIKHVYPDGSSDRYEYDANDNLLLHIRPDDSTVQMAYDDKDQLIRITDPLGNIWLREYDDKGNLLKEIDPKQYATSYSYNPQGLPIAIKDAKGGTKKLAYLPNGQIASFTDCSGSCTEWHYDANGRLLETQDAAGNLTQYRYGSDGRLEAAKQADGTEAKLQFDAEGRLLSHTDALGRSTRYGYDKAGRIHSRIDAMGQELAYRYDKLGRLTALQNENSAQYRFSYDPVGRLIEENSFDGKATRYHYAEASGQLLEVNEAGQLTQLNYDAAGRLAQRKTGSSKESFRYDPAGRLAIAKNRFSQVVFNFDEVGDLTREEHHYQLFGQSQTHIWQHEYDELGNRIASIRPDGQRTDWLVYGSGHVHGMLWNKQEITSFERDKLHRETGRKLANQLQAQTQYDPMGRMLQQTLSGKTSSNRSYQYDPVGQLLGIKDSRKGETQYRYDPVGRLLAANTPKHQETFAFDPASNLLDSAGKAENTLPSQTPRILDNLLKQYAGTHFKYDARGNLTEKQRGEQITKLSWDGFNRLSEVQTAQGVTQYYYDAFGRRIGKENAQGQTAFIWDGDVIALEKTANQTRHYLFEPNSFIPLAQIVSANDSEQEHTAYYHVDHLGTPQTLSDENGEIAWSAEYKAWGEAQVVISEAAKEAGINNPIRFQGQYADEESGLHYNRHRYYDPEIGRFISSDPIKLAGGRNLHQYAPNPIGWIDPFGLVHETAPGYHVYGLYEPGKSPDRGDSPYYVGITDDLDRRNIEHGKSGRLAGGTMEPIMRDVDYGTARGVEQANIEHHGTKTGTIGQDLSTATTYDERGNKVASFDHKNSTRCPKRQQHFENAYNNEIKRLNR